MSPSAEPYNDEKYKVLMDGLECTTQTLKQVVSDGLRFDSDFYSKKNLSTHKTLERIGKKTINEYCGVLDCSAFYPSITGYYSKNRDLIPFLRVNEINNGLITISDGTVFLPMHVLESNEKTIARAYPGDIIIAKGGNTLAKVGLVTEEYPIYATCRDVIILRTNQLNGINKYFLWAFLHSSYGQDILWRSASQTGQPHLTLPAIMKIHIPDAPSLQVLVEKAYRQSVDLEKQSVQRYFEAEKSLYEFLHLQDDIYDDNQGYTTKALSKSFRITGRFDAEYYQTKYQRIAASLMTKKTVGSVCTIHDENVSPKDDKMYQYIELANVGNYGTIANTEAIIGANLPSRARRMVSTGQVIVSSIEGSLQSCAIINNEYNNALCSTGFYVIDSESINSESLLVLFKSKPIQALLKQRCSGTILTAISKDEFLTIPLPNIDENIQRIIASKVRESFDLRKRSKQLLEYAKEAVEMAIEQGEAVAFAWLKDRVGV